MTDDLKQAAREAVTVPRVPTEAMIAATAVADLGGSIADIWTAMIEAAPAAPDVWRDMRTAPRDGTLLVLLVRPYANDEDGAWTPFEDSRDPQPTIGFNNLDNTEEDRWQFAGWHWSQDHIIEGDGEVLGWAPFTTPVPAEIERGPAEAAAGPVGEAVAVSRSELKDVCDLLAERKYGSPARSPAHNARLMIESILARPVEEPSEVERLTRDVEFWKGRFQAETKARIAAEASAHDEQDAWPSDGSCIRCGSVPRNADGLCATCVDEGMPLQTEVDPEWVARASVSIAQMVNEWHFARSAPTHIPADLIARRLERFVPAAEAALAETRERLEKMEAERDAAREREVKRAVNLRQRMDNMRCEIAEMRANLGKLMEAAGKARTALAGFTSVDDAAFALDVAISDLAEWKRQAALSTQERAR